MSETKRYTSIIEAILDARHLDPAGIEAVRLEMVRRHGDRLDQMMTGTFISECLKAERAVRQ